MKVIATPSRLMNCLENLQGITTGGHYISRRLQTVLVDQFAGRPDKLRRLASSVHLPPITQTQNGNQNLLVPDLANQAPVANPVFPEFSELASFERITNAARVFQNRDSFAQERPYVLRYWRIKFGELLLNRFR